MNKEELQKVRENHELWLYTNGSMGKRANLEGVYLVGANLVDAYLEGANLVDAYLEGANLRDADLRGANLEGTDLVDANLKGVNLKGANLRSANLRGANLVDANLKGVNLKGANLRDANLEGASLVDADLESTHLKFANLKNANLEGANLGCAYFEYANLEGTNLVDANLKGANLRSANLTNAKLPKFQIPQNVELTGWKRLEDRRIAKLRIPAEAKRTASLIGNKCRCEYAEVVEITSKDGSKTFEDGQSLHTVGFEYQVGMKIEPDSYDDDIRVECTNGIHFFLDREDAVNYNII